MENFLKNRQFFNILLLICLVGFLIYPNISLADESDDITLEDLGKYLELPQKEAQKLMGTLKQVLTTKGIYLWSSGHTTDEEIAAAVILLKVVKVEILNHLLVDAPLEVTKKIISAAVDIVQIYINPSISLEKIEKLTVEKAIEEGKKQLFQNEIRVTPGAIEFKYPLRKGGESKVIFQYIMIYDPLDTGKGEVVIRFYSPNPIGPPNPDKFSRLLQVPNLQHDLSPFIVEIKGVVEKTKLDTYRWTEGPSVNIDFPPEVPDLGIKPLSFWERHLLKPITSKIKEIEFIITKITGKTPKIVERISDLPQIISNVWREIKSTFPMFFSLSPGALVETPIAGEEQLSIDETLEPLTVTETSEGIISGFSLEEVVEVEPRPVEMEPKGGPVPTLEEMQEIFDDISEIVDILNQEVIELVEARLQPTGEVEEPKEIAEGLEKIEEIEEVVEETEEIIEIAEESDELVENYPQQTEGETVLCEKPGESARDKVIINEIAWMGTNNSANDEWIELKNISVDPVNLAGWQLLDKEKQIKIIFSQETILVNGFFLLERTNDDSVSAVVADLIYTGALGNTNEALYLFDENCQLQDEVLALPSWPAGDNSSKRTMERKYDLSWQTSANSGGTPKNENSSGYTPYYGGGGFSPSPPPPAPEEPLAVPSSPPQILITEIQIRTTTSTDHDFIELYNLATSSVDISGFQLKKKSSTGNEYSIRVFPENNIIAAQNYFLWLNSSYASTSQISADATSSQTLAQNNSLVLLDKDKNVIDAVAWGSSTNPFVETNPFSENPNENQSLGRKWSTTTQSYTDSDDNQSDFELQTPTPRANNQSPVVPENQLPTAQFTYTPEVPLVGQEITFDASSSTDSDGEVASFVWDFGDSTTTTNQATTTHSYAASSDYLIELIVIDNDGATSSPATTTISTIQEETPLLAVVINEIAWMGTKASDWDEWIELYNNTTSTIDLTGWTFSWSHGTTSHSITISTSTAATTTIPASSFYLLERAEKATDIAADLIYRGQRMSNNGEKLELRDASSTLIDIVDCSSEWFAGKASPDYISMERINPLSESDSDNWASNNRIARNGLTAEKEGQKYRISGTPKTENSVSKSETQIPSPSVLPFNEFNELTFTYLGSPYIIGNTLYVLGGKTLNIEPGVTVRFNPNWGAEIQGTLKAIGEENKKIIFTSSATPTYWGGIYFTSSSTNSELNWTEVKYGKRGNGESPAILVENSSIILKNSTLEKYTDRGLKLVNSNSTIEKVNFFGSGTTTSIVAIDIKGSSPTITNSTFLNNTTAIEITGGTVSDSSITIENNIFEQNKTPIHLKGVTYPNFSGNIARNNDLNGILISASTIIADTIWQADLPYVIENHKAIESQFSLTLEAGTVVKFNPGGYLTVRGQLITEGTADNLVVITTIHDDEFGGDTNNNETNTSPAKAHWQSITFHSSGSILDGARIRYGGAINKGVITQKKDAIININNSKIEENILGIFSEESSCEKAFEKIIIDNLENTFFNNTKNIRLGSGRGYCFEQK